MEQKFADFHDLKDAGFANRRISESFRRKYIDDTCSPIDPRFSKLDQQSVIAPDSWLI
jgi:hypothetical protein